MEEKKIYMNPLKISILFLLLSLASCEAGNAATPSQPISHAIFDELLKKHVTPEGAVSYKGFIQDISATVSGGALKIRKMVSNKKKMVR